MRLHWVLGFSISDDHGYLWKSFPGSSCLSENVSHQVLYGIAFKKKFMCIFKSSLAIRLKNMIQSLLINIVPVMVFPPLYGSELIAWSRSPLLV